MPRLPYLPGVPNGEVLFGEGWQLQRDFAEWLHATGAAIALLCFSSLVQVRPAELRAAPKSFDLLLGPRHDQDAMAEEARSEIRVKVDFHQLKGSRPLLKES